MTTPQLRHRINETYFYLYLVSLKCASLLLKNQRFMAKESSNLVVTQLKVLAHFLAENGRQWREIAEISACYCNSIDSRPWPPA